MLTDEQVDALIDPFMTGEDGQREAARSAFRAGAAWQREEDARIAEAYATEKWDAYKRGNGPGRADPHVQGLSCGADDVADAIRRAGEQT
jgi:hypothetical protein